MRKTLLVSVLAFAVLGALVAESPTPIALAEGSHYAVYSELGQVRASSLLTRLEALFSLYNGLFRFDEKRLPGKLQVREFESKEAFDAYLERGVGESRGDFVYIHYQNPSRRELLLFSKDEPEFGKSLAHQAFIQFLKAFVENPPLWMRDGFAVYFETARWDEASQKLVFPENLAWLSSVKALKAQSALLPLSRLLTLREEEARSSIEVFYPEAWAFVSFLMEGKVGYDRLLWEGLATLGAAAGLEENQAAFQKRLDTWYGSGAAEKAFATYLESRKTFPELLSAGIEAYNQKDFPAAQSAFEAAAGLDPSSAVPPYYLGLIAYGLGDYARADYLYRNALNLGCDAATANYAIGLNALAQGKTEDAKAALAEAAAAAPERYREKVESLLSRLSP